MKSLEYVKTHINEFEEDDFFDRRFTKLFIDFLPVSEWEKYGFRFTGEPGTEPDPEEWTEENIMKKLKRETYFGHETVEGEHGISSELMAMVVRGWCKVLELPDLVLDDDHDGLYHWRQFNVVAKHFGWDLNSEEDDDLIRSINETIAIAIFHGGDPGGAYCIFPDRLEKSMDILAKKLGTTWEWDHPKWKHFPMLKCRDGTFCKIPDRASTDERGEE